jgi:arsenate reductase
MAEIGIDISNYKSNHVKDFLSQHFGYIITVCDEADEKCPTFPDISVRMHWPFEDPAKTEGSEDEKLLDFRKIRDQIKEKILEWLKEM